MSRLMARIISVLVVLIACCSAPAQDSQREEWVGKGQLGPTPLFLQIVIDKKAGTMRVHAPHLLVFNGKAQNIREEDRLTFDLAVRGAVLEVSIKRDDDDKTRGTAIVRFVSGPESATALEPVTFALARRPDLASLEDAERFSADLQIPNGGSLGFSIVLAELDGELFGAVDIPAQGVHGLALECEKNGEDLVLKLPVPSPASMTLARDGDTLAGTFSQGPLNLPISFEKGEMAAVTIRAPRPQEPKLPYPYDVADMRLPTRTGHELAGTLFMPRERPTAGAPFVVLVSGSGAQNRDEELLDHKPFLVLADRLGRAGIASFRYDDRGSFESEGDFALATTPDFAHDAMSMLDHFRSDPRIDAARSGIMGHSEGGIVAAIAGSGQTPGFEGTPPPAFIVMLAGTGVSGADLLKEQMKQLLIAEGVDAETITGISEAQSALLDAVVSDASDEVLRERTLELTTRQLLMNGIFESTSEEARATMVDQAIAQVTSPWMDSFLRYDPGGALRACNLPVLAINGMLDRQVWHDQNLPAIRSAVTAAGGEVTILRVPGVNHLLQPATTGAVSEYASIETTIDEGVLKQITEWINQR